MFALFWQDPHHTQCSNRRLLPEDSAAGEMLPADVRSDGQERTARGETSSVNLRCTFTGAIYF